MIAGELTVIQYCEVCGVRLPGEEERRTVHMKTMHKNGNGVDRGWDFCVYCGVRIKREHMEGHIKVFHRRGSFGPGQA